MKLNFSMNFVGLFLNPWIWVAGILVAAVLMLLLKL